MKKLITLMMVALCAAGCMSTKTKKAYEYKKTTTAVVVIGVEDSKKFGKCAGSKIDAINMTNLLKDYSENSTVLVSKDAKYDAVAKAMKQACQNDLAIIYYSGHGGSVEQVVTEETKFIEPSGYDSFLCLYDKAMLDDEVWEIISKAKGRVVMIFDCCHSKTMFRDAGSFLKFKDEQTLFAAKRDENSPDILILSGCADDSYSYGSAIGGEMTNAILRYFKKDKSYGYVYGKVLSDKRLTKMEEVSVTEIGDSFKSREIFK